MPSDCFAASPAAGKSVPVLAENEQVPRPFAYKIVNKLQRAGIVAVSRGAAGGASLNRPLAAFTLLDLLRALDDHPTATACTRTPYHCDWCEHHRTDCRAYQHMAQLQRRLEAELAAHTLQAVIFDLPDRDDPPIRIPAPREAP
ncbi:Rrf2 family transcriptional regulator [Pseudoramibacter sp. HA2172]|uniref:Rrf2 family transcriptional regulator n=1 Tax=Pseudoramibacter faecis TaxID=3108534 RepID=UPI002E78F6EE|nr:Rrf2 family transcriptional regulator [Pseudoramibacter sp. HA2172]